MFPTNVLENPKSFAEWFDNSFEHLFLKEYDNVLEIGKLALENGYAEHNFNIKGEIGLPNFFNPIYIDVVYTHYPIRKEDWKTNYYELLANRLKELFKLDPMLNSSRIQWRFILQTNCTNGVEANEMFHGIVLGYNNIIPQKLLGLNAIELPIFIDDSIAPKHHNLIATNSNEELYEDDLKTILYPESLFNRELKQHLPPRERMKNEPGCSSFTTRADKPKQSLWARLFR
jgi:hypothetical protein